VQPDTIIPSPYNPQSLNRYSYTYNNPIRYTDPTGHCPFCVAAIAYAKVVALNVAVDTAIDYALAVVFNEKFDLGDSVKTNLVIDAVTAGIGGKIAKSGKIAKAIGKYGDDISRTAGKLLGVHPGTLGSEIISEGMEKVAKEWTEDALREVAQQSIQNSGKKPVFALGRFNVPSGSKKYTEIADAEGFAYFQIPEEYRGLPNSAQKQVNLLALEIAHNLGYEFRVVTDYGWDWATSGLGDELRFLWKEYRIDLFPD
jgi:hypothetical protein